MPLTKIFVSLLLSGWMMMGGAYAQKYATQSAKAIKLYEKGNEYFQARRFDDGVAALLKAVAIDEQFIEAHYKLATTYQLFQEYEESAKYFRKVIDLAPQDARYQSVYNLVASQELQKGNYTQAQEIARRGKGLNLKNTQHVAKAEEILATCEYALEGKKNPLDFRPQSLPSPLNEFQVQYFPVLTGDEQMIIYTVHKEDETEDLFVSYQQDGKWTAPQPLSPQINTPDNEGTCSISADGQVLVFTYCANLKLRRSFGDCDLYISYRQGKQWSEPQNLGPNVNSAAKDTQPALSADGNTLYFASNRKGSLGGLDLWVSRRDADGKWQLAENLGPTFNTAGSEVSPFIHANNRYLYFSSNGRPAQSYGGYDLYQSEWVNRAWTTPQNLGYPVNDHADQVALFITTDGKKAYYTFEEKIGGRKAYKSVLKVFDIPEAIQPKIKSNYVKGYVYDAKTRRAWKPKSAFLT
ncbi:MAG: hypothetical protein HC913_12820 [Microscillaceae bacterium]|nr:hypothetical protein [Microscillaceae bacterium]